MNNEERDLIEGTIKLAKKEVDHDPHLANFYLRDLPIIKELELEDLCWSVHQLSFISSNDVRPIIEAIEKHLGEIIEHLN